jgi:hypothetical protein
MFNCYDSQIYVVGQGSSQLTVTAPNTVTTVGVPLTIRGTITDISAGTKQNQQATNFPNGVPVVSDASMSEFMAALYEDQAMPNNVTGVPVIIYVLDSNGNYRTIGTVTSDANGMYSLTWMPDISGDFTVYAKFAGTQGYFGSSAETSFTAVNAPATPTPTAQPLTSVTDQYFVPAVAGIIVAIVIVGAALALLTLRKRA